MKIKSKLIQILEQYYFLYLKLFVLIFVDSPDVLSPVGKNVGRFSIKFILSRRHFFDWME
jgi:hypothetical protein